MTSERFEKGLKVRKEVLGGKYVEAALLRADSFSREFQELVTEYCWGEVWGQGTLSKQQHSLLNVAILSALNRPEEFKIHFRGALKNGCSLTELQETLKQVAIYCGIPAGVEAFRLAREVLNEEGVEVDS